MNTRARRRMLLTASLVSISALALAGCSSSGEASGDGSDEKITLTITTFGTFGYDDLYKEYESAHPNIKIEANNIDTGGNARTDAFTKLAAGSGLSDIVATEEGWLGSIMEVSDQFVDLKDYGIEDRKGDWVDWKYDQATDPKGRVIGYGTDIGPMGICFNGPALKAAGMPSDREGFAELLGGDDATWQDYIEVGKQYKQKTGKAWYDQSSFVWNAMVNQLDEGYYTSDGKLNIEGNPQLEERWGWISDAVASGLSAAQARWDWNGGKSFVDGTFATFMCPGWMLGVIQGSAESGGGTAETGWDFADVFPGGPANWGGSFLSIPETSQHKKEAAALADWLTQPEQQMKQSAAAGNFPSTIKAEESLAADATPNKFFNDAPTGAILAERAKGVKAQFKGPDDSVIQENAFQVALDALDRGDATSEEAWQQALDLVDELVD